MSEATPEARTTPAIQKASAGRKRLQLSDDSPLSFTKVDIDTVTKPPNSKN